MNRFRKHPTVPYLNIKKKLKLPKINKLLSVLNIIYFQIYQYKLPQNVSVATLEGERIHFSISSPVQETSLQIGY